VAKILSSLDNFNNFCKNLPHSRRLPLNPDYLVVEEKIPLIAVAAMLLSGPERLLIHHLN
jgi:hypothetical protein